MAARAEFGDLTVDGIRLLNAAAKYAVSQQKDAVLGKIALSGTTGPSGQAHRDPAARTARLAPGWSRSGGLPDGLLDYCSDCRPDPPAFQDRLRAGLPESPPRRVGFLLSKGQGHERSPQRRRSPALAR